MNLYRSVVYRTNLIETIKNNSKIDQVAACNAYEPKKNSPDNNSFALAFQIVDGLKP